MTEKPLYIAEKMVLGTAQFGMDYGITNISGKPSKEVVFDILELAWTKGVRRFDTAPGYGSEALVGEFITANSLQEEIKVLTKIPSLEGLPDYEIAIRTSVELSLKNLGCPIDVLFFHDPEDSSLLLKDLQFFEILMRDYPVGTIGVSVYDTQEVENLFGCQFELAFQFPFNVLNRQFEEVKMPDGKRYARSVFLQGILASQDELRSDVPEELLNIKKKYHKLLHDHLIDPVSFAISFVVNSIHLDYFLLGVETQEQLIDILSIETCKANDLIILLPLLANISNKWIDPRTWN